MAVTGAVATYSGFFAIPTINSSTLDATDPELKPFGQLTRWTEALTVGS